MQKRLILSLAVFFTLFLSTFTAKADFSIPTVEASFDRGLFVEILLKCDAVFSDSKTMGIMSFQKTENKYCSSKQNCFKTARAAAIQSCNVDKQVSDQMQDIDDDNGFGAQREITRQ
jgi:hypothetical protein